MTMHRSMLLLERLFDSCIGLPLTVGFTVAAQFLNYTGFQHLVVNYLVVYQLATTLDIVFITAGFGFSGR